MNKNRNWSYSSFLFPVFYNFHVSMKQKLLSMQVSSFFIKTCQCQFPPLDSEFLTCDPTPYLVIPTTLCPIGYRNILESVPVLWKCTCGHHHITAAAAANIISRKVLIILYPVRYTTRWHFFLQLCRTALKSLYKMFMA